MDADLRSLELARAMLRGAVWAFRVENQRGACTERLREVRQNLVFWRERFESLSQARQALKH